MIQFFHRRVCASGSNLICTKMSAGMEKKVHELNVVHKKDSIHVSKSSGTDVNYYIFDEAEIHVNRINPHAIQEWHFHEHISENLLMTKGKLLCRYIDSEKAEQDFYVTEGDLIDIGSSIHTFENDTDDVAEFVIFRYVPSGVNRREMIKNDKTVVDPIDFVHPDREM